ncbi:MAG: DUF4159 domain-containing protein [Planctomycetota bacterium]|nr:DUF4159 domain-containing protein [Planctomycetota bacterium]
MQQYTVGPSALVVYALLESGASVQEPRMVNALRFLRDGQTNRTYSLGLRANVWLAASRQDNKYLQQLRKDVELLCKSTANGSYTYTSMGDHKSSGDNSNSQYGLLGVWAGAQANLEVPKQYWWLVMQHWLNCQYDDGGWSYTTGQPNSAAAMSTAGVASLYVCFDNLFSDGFVKCDVNTEFKPIKAGLLWFDRNFAKTFQGKVPLGHSDLYYYLYGVERVGLASGYKYFGTADWYKIGATELLRRSSSGGWAGGKWGNDVSTAFALLFLLRGRHPILFNKLEFHGDWNNRPRDLASLTRWMSRTFEKTVNWQIINLRVPVSEWHDAPILYISASKAPEFTDQDIKKLRRYVWQGGTLLSVRECDGKGFGDGIRKVYKKLFPDYEMTPCPQDHELYSVYFPLRSRPKLHTISNGVRSLVIHTDEDLSRSWQLRNLATEKWAFESAANVFMYVTDKGVLRHRGTSPWPEAKKLENPTPFKLARLKHSSNYDPEPLAYERFALRMGNEENVKLQVLGPIEIKKLPEAKVKLAVMSGTGEFHVTDEEKEALKQFLAAGGTLVIDAAGGSSSFAASTEKLLADMYGIRAIRRLATTSPIYDVKDHEIQRVKYRRRTVKALGPRKEPVLQAVLLDTTGTSRPAVLYSRQDLTAGLVGYPAYAVDGYAPESAYEIMRNIVLYVLSQPDAKPASQPAKPDK